MSITNIVLYTNMSNLPYMLLQTSTYGCEAAAKQPAVC